MLKISLASLRIRLLALVLLAVIPALGLILYSASEQRQLAVDAVKENALRLTHLAVDNQERLVEGTHQLLTTLAQLPDVRQGGATCQTLLAELVTQYSSYTGISAIEPDGDVYCSSIPLNPPRNVADRPHIQQAFQTGAFTASEYQIGRITGRPVLGLAYPVLNRTGQVQAVIGAGLDLAWFNQFAAKAQLPAGATFTLLDPHGMILARYPDPEPWLGQPVPEAQLVRTILAQSEGTMALVSEDGVSRLYAFTPLPALRAVEDERVSDTDGNAYVSIGIPTGIAFADVDRTLARNLVALGVVAGLGLVVAWFGSEIFILGRVKALVNATKRLSAGDLSARTGLTYGAGELSQLAHAFDEMAQVLQQREGEREQAEKALRDSEKRFRALIENSSDAVALFNAEGTILYGSPATSRILGYPLEEFVGRNALELIHPDDHEGVRRCLTEVMQEPGARVNVHAHLLHHDGSWRFSEGVFTNLLAEPAVGAIVNNYRDITRRKQMEQTLQEAHDGLEARVEQRTAELTKANEQLAALYQMGQVITVPLRSEVVLDLIARSTAQLLETETSVILLLDEAGETLTIKGAYGLSEQVIKGTRDRVGESIAGRVIQTGQAIIANDLPNDPRFYNPAAANEGLLACASVPLVVGEKIIGTLDAHSKVNRHAFTETHLYTLKMLAGQAAIAIENARLYEEVQQGRNELEERVQQRTAELVAANEQLQQEISERKRAEAGLRQTATELARSNTELQQFAYVASHDLQEPLRMVASYTQLLARRYKGKLDADADDFINYAVDGANRMRGLINDLLTYSRVGTHGKTLTQTNIEMALNQALANLELSITESKAVITHDSLPTLLADDTQLVQLFQNLISNALKFRTAQPPQIHISAAQQDQYWLFSVQDNGIGIEPHYAERIFVIFQRLHSKDKYPGSGIGLAICKRIVERHNGHIWFESPPGQGTIFYFTLPVYGGKNGL